MLKYFNAHYSANLMTLCIVGNHQLDYMEQLVVSDFSQIKNKEIKVKDYSHVAFYDSKKTLGHLVKVVPVKDTKILYIKWPDLANNLTQWDGSAPNYVEHVIGQQGTNSLVSELIRQGLATKLQASHTSRL